jgi:hypothetical protein
MLSYWPLAVPNKFLDSIGDRNLSPSLVGTVASAELSPPFDATVNLGGMLRYALPDRIGSDSNKTVIVNHFSAPGSYEVMSRGYMDPAHEEKSAYNALPWRNSSVRGLTGFNTISGSEETTTSISVDDHADHSRGLQALLSLHCGPFGSDPTWLPLTGAIAVTQPRLEDLYNAASGSKPAFHKVNRNRRYRIEATGDSGSEVGAPVITGSLRDNGYVQHPIPRAARGYRWIKDCLHSGSDYFTYTELSGGFVTSLPMISASDFGIGFNGGKMQYGYSKKVIDTDFPANFAGLNLTIYEPLTCSSNHLGYPLNVPLAGNDANVPVESTYLNSKMTTHGFRAGLVNGFLPEGAILFNSLMLHRNGPYGYPTWKQIRTGETPVVRHQRSINVVSQRDYESQFIFYGNGWETTVHGIKGNTFTSYIEQPLSSRHKPISMVFGSQGTGLARLSWANNLDYFSNERLNNRLNLVKEANLGTPYHNAVNYVLGSNTSVIEYTERTYPRETSAYQNRFRARTEYTSQMGLASGFDGYPQIWNSSRDIRSISGSLGTSTVNSQGHAILNASCWPLDGPISDAERSVITGSGGGGITTNDLSGELFNNYCRFAGPASGTIKPAALYATLVPIGIDTGADPMYYGGAKFEVDTLTGQQPYRSYEEHMEYLRLIGKDHSIVPEFRISEHIEKYVTENGSNWLIDIDEASPGMFDITGAAINSSYDLGSKVCDIADTDEFYKVYGTDFWKYFKIIDSDLNNKVSSDGSPLNKKLILECSALVKPLFYKGFYPVERTLELATLFSRSYGDYVSSSSPAAYRALVEPLFAPGILYNTIKSGIAVGNYVLVNGEWPGQTAANYDVSGSQAFNCAFEGAGGRLETWTNGAGLRNAVIDHGTGSVLSASNPRVVGEYGLQRIPFEALMRPEVYLNTGVHTADSTAATATVTWYAGDRPEAGDTITIIDAAGVSKAYLAAASEDLSSNPPKWHASNTTTTQVDSLQNCIESANGHNGSILVSQDGTGLVMTLIQVTTGLDGNTSIAVGGATSGQISATNFSGGSNPDRSALAYGNISGSHIFDTGLASASLSRQTGVPSERCSWDGSGDPLYRMAVDNFLCETVNFFLKKDPENRPNGLATIVGDKDDSLWGDIKDGTAYAMTVHMKRPTNPKSGRPDFEIFNMFNRGSGFGYPVALNQDNGIRSSGSLSASYAHVTPGYFNGGCSVTMTYVADFTGKPTFGDIQPNLTFQYSRDLENRRLSPSWAGSATGHAYAGAGTDQYTTASPGYWFAQQISGSLDLFEYVQKDDGGYCMLQSKFETPVLNFPSNTTSVYNQPVNNSNVLPGSSAAVKSVGMWCQSGAVPDDAATSVSISLTVPESVTVDGTTYRGDSCKSLADIVGLDGSVGKKVPIGVIADEQVLEEAVITVPFTVEEGRRKFFDAADSPAVLDRMVENMHKYVFPPKFETKLPLFFSFEFDYTIERDDLVKLYQNVMFDSDHEKIDGACSPLNQRQRRNQICSCCIEDEKLINQIYGCIDELKWLVFKVKKRAGKDYDIQRREQIDSPAIIRRRRTGRGQAPTYNWPYDYFSLVELIKIDATAQYSSVGFETLQTQRGAQETSDVALVRQGRVMTNVTGEAATEQALSTTGLSNGKTGIKTGIQMSAGTAKALLTGQGGSTSAQAQGAALAQGQALSQTILDLLS